MSLSSSANLASNLRAGEAGAGREFVRNVQHQSRRVIAAADCAVNASWTNWSGFRATWQDGNDR
jgi:hypothetical protein